jgi:uncharacterized protein YcbX
MLQVSELFIYPIKSMAGISANKAVVTDRGFEYDRRWMLVDENNLFISQREIPQLALMQVEITENGLKVTYRPDGQFIPVPFQPQTNEFADLSIWDDTCTGQFVSETIDQWFREKLGIYCRLAYMPDQSIRLTDPKYTSQGHITSFSDGYPFLLISQSSLDDLNSRLDEPLPMNRFRPNIVCKGGEPFSEDLLHTFSIGNIQFHGVKLCARCPIPTIDQETLARGKEPLKTLARYRFKNNKILFGQNLIHEGLGEICVGDELTVLRLNEEERFFVNV